MDTGSELAKIYVSDLKNRPKGTVISNDTIAIGFVEYCREPGVKIPRQIPVVSFDNIVFSSLYDISLTTVGQHVREMSEHAARLMLKQLKNPQEKPEQVILDPTLIVRRTTCPYVPEQDGEQTTGCWAGEEPDVPAVPDYLVPDRSVAEKVNIKTGISILEIPVFCLQKMGVEPIRYYYHTDLNRARLPIPPLLYFVLFCCLVQTVKVIINEQQ